MRNERIVISRQRLLDEVWGYDPFSTTNTIEVFVSNLRRKLEADGEPRLLHTIGEPATSFAPRLAGLSLKPARNLLGAPRRAVERLSASFDRLPIRVRLAGVSALLTFVILCGFAVAIGSLTVHRIRSDFNREVATPPAAALAAEHQSQPHDAADRRRSTRRSRTSPTRVRSRRDQDPHARRCVVTETAKRPRTRRPLAPTGDIDGYRVLSRPGGRGRRHRRADRPWSSSTAARRDTEATVTRVELFLLLGVLAGTGLALLAGMTIARRAMAPIAQLTATAAEIARTRDPSRGVPQSEADDEVAELARTLEGMLRELDAARGRPRRCSPPAPVRRRRLARAAHAADERARQPRAARRIAARRSGRGGALGPALLAAHAPAGRRPAAAGAHRRRARGPRASRATWIRSSSRRPPSWGR
jgi:HAMP domain-containing protein